MARVVHATGSEVLVSNWMPRNEASWDRGLRVAIGIGLLALAAAPTPPWGWIGLVGLVPLATGLAGTCPIYTVFGVGTCPVH